VPFLRLAQRTEMGANMADKQPSFSIKDGPWCHRNLCDKIVSTTFDGHTIAITFGAGGLSQREPMNSPKGWAFNLRECRIALSPLRPSSSSTP